MPLTESLHSRWQPPSSNKWHICFQDVLCCFLTATQKISFSLNRSPSCDILICSFSRMITTPSQMPSATSLNVAFQRTSHRATDPWLLPWSLPSPSPFLIWGGWEGGKQVPHKNYFNTFYCSKHLENILLGRMVSIEHYYSFYKFNQAVACSSAWHNFVSIQGSQSGCSSTLHPTLQQSRIQKAVLQKAWQARKRSPPSLPDSTT